MTDEAKLIEFVENAKETGKIKIGINEVTKTIERGKAKAVVYAEDVDPKEIVMHLPAICKEKEIPAFSMSSKEKLGKASGISVPASAIAITQLGEAENLLKGLKESE